MNTIKDTWARRPVLVNSVVGFTVFALGDALAQALEDPKKEWDLRRSLSIGLLGIVQNGIFLRAWYRALDTFVTPKTDAKSVLKKIACDEAIFAPQLACSYLAWSAYIQHNGDLEAVTQNIRDKALQTWQSDLKVWPMANMVGFTFVPRPIRPLYASGVQLMWQCYLSTVGFSEASSSVTI